MIAVRPISAAATRDLRQRVLRPDQRSDELVRPGDDDPRTRHFGAMDAERLLAIATIMPEPEPDGPGDWRSTRPTDASASSLALWRIRGVATEPDARGRGAGRSVVEACLAHARANGGRVVWLNGRVASAAFYEKLGFEIVGAPFDTPPSGMHHRFVRRLDPPAGPEKKTT